MLKETGRLLRDSFYIDDCEAVLSHVDLLNIYLRKNIKLQLSVISST